MLISVVINKKNKSKDVKTMKKQMALGQGN